jgi:hypothetical protein
MTSSTSSDPSSAFQNYATSATSLNFSEDTVSARSFHAMLNIAVPTPGYPDNLRSMIRRERKYSSGDNVWIRLKSASKYSLVPMENILTRLQPPAIGMVAL